MKNFVLIISLILGGIIGILFPQFSITIKPLGTLFLNLMFMIVVPLVFFVISTSIMKLKKKNNLNKLLIKTIKYFIITTLIATLFMFIMMLLFNPIHNFKIIEVVTNYDKINVLDSIVNAISVGDFINLFSKNNMLALIIFSIIFGFLNEDENIYGIFKNFSNVFLKMIDIVFYYAPIGIFSFFASTIAEYGVSALKSYSLIIILYYISSIIYFLIFYTLYSYKNNKLNGIINFYKNIIPSVICSLSTQSSIATLPTNIKVSKKMKIDENITDLVLPIGSSMHMEGSCMSSVIKIIFLFTIYNMSFLNPLTIISIIFVSLLSGVVMSGIPGGGLMGEVLIVSLYSFPQASLGMIAAIGLLVDPPATMLNVVGDITTSLLIDREKN